LTSLYGFEHGPDGGFDLSVPLEDLLSETGADASDYVECTECHEESYCAPTSRDADGKVYEYACPACGQRFKP
jgi:hypothetical protein